MSAQNSPLVHIARPYATALYELASEAKKVSEVEESLLAISKLVDDSDDFSRFLRSPVITADVKSAAIAKILDAAKTPELVANFIRLVAKNGRLFALPAMITAFRNLAAEERGEIRAEVTSAVALTKDQIKSLAETLKKTIGKTVALDEHVDKSLIGGLMVKVGSRMIDTSLKTKLTAMKIAMKEVG